MINDLFKWRSTRGYSHHKRNVSVTTTDDRIANIMIIICANYCIKWCVFDYTPRSLVERTLLEWRCVALQLTTTTDQCVYLTEHTLNSLKMEISWRGVSSRVSSAACNIALFITATSLSHLPTCPWALRLPIAISFSNWDGHNSCKRRH